MAVCRGQSWRRAGFGAVPGVHRKSMMRAAENPKEIVGRQTIAVLVRLFGPVNHFCQTGEVRQITLLVHSDDQFSRLCLGIKMRDRKA